MNIFVKVVILVQVRTYVYIYCNTNMYIIPQLVQTDS